MKYLLKKTFFVVLLLFCFMFTLTTFCDDADARRRGNHDGNGKHGGSGDCASVPEPSTLMLLAAGAGVCCFTKKKNKK